MRVLRSERGGISAEYVALLAVVVAIIAAIPYADIGAAVRGEVEEPICAIATDRDLEGGCGRDGERSDSAGRGANSPPPGKPSRGLGPIVARRAAVPVAQTVTGRPASSRGGRGGATLLPVAAARPPARPASIGPLVREVVRGIGRLFGKGRKPPARPAPKPPAKPKPKPAPKIDIEDAKAVRGADPTDIRRIARERGYEVLPAKKGGGGERFFKPGTNRADGIRIMRGDPKAPPGIKRGPYAVITKGGAKTRAPLKGNPVK